MTNEEWRNHEFYTFDPFAKDIQPALLNSADIKKYVVEGCLIRDDFDDRRLKTASYEMRFLGKLHYWKMIDGRMEKRCREVSCGDDVILPRNSITYLWMKENLFLPQYIAARFNLHIRHVHKGILLGTGPLVDPGFSGKLLIPLHNLTDNNYKLKGGEGIIWVEFTKLSRHEFWYDRENRDNPPDLVSFPDIKNLTDPDSYFNKSGVYRKGGVQSAFRGELDRIDEIATNAEKDAKDARKSAEFLRNIGLIAIVASIILICLSGYNLISHAVDRVQGSKNEIISSNIRTHDDQLKKLEQEMENMRANIRDVSKEVSELKIKKSDGARTQQ